VASQARTRCLVLVAKRISGMSSDQEILVGLGKVMRERRLAMGLSQEALAYQAGLDRSHMGKIERGERNVTLLNIQRVAKVLGCPASTLLREAGF
jgi:transcriptional regulator with XRE-family HTH domain